MLFLLLWTVALKWPLQGTSLGEVYGDPGVPSHQNPPLGLSNVVQRRAEWYIWHQLGCRSCWKEIKANNPTALGAPLLVFPWGLLTQQWRFEIWVFLLLEGCLSWLMSSIYLKQLVLRHQRPAFAFSLVSRSSSTGLRG